MRLLRCSYYFLRFEQFFLRATHHLLPLFLDVTQCHRQRDDQCDFYSSLYLRHATDHNRPMLVFACPLIARSRDRSEYSKILRCFDPDTFTSMRTFHHPRTCHPLGINRTCVFQTLLFRIAPHECHRLIYRCL